MLKEKIDQLTKDEAGQDGAEGKNEMMFMSLAYVCSWNLIIVILTIIAANSVSNAVEFIDVDLGLAGQILTDWETQPFVNITVTTQDCPSGTHAVF